MTIDDSGSTYAVHPVAPPPLSLEQRGQVARKINLEGSVATRKLLNSLPPDPEQRARVVEEFARITTHVTVVAASLAQWHNADEHPASTSDDGDNAGLNALTELDATLTALSKLRTTLAFALSTGTTSDSAHVTGTAAAVTARMRDLRGVSNLHTAVHDPHVLAAVATELITATTHAGQLYSALTVAADLIAERTDLTLSDDVDVAAVADEAAAHLYCAGLYARHQIHFLETAVAQLHRLYPREHNSST